MLPPDYYEDCADDIVELYSQFDEAVISDITRRIVKTGTVTETAKGQIRQAQEMGLLYSDILQEIAKRTDATTAIVKALFEDAGVKAVKIDGEAYRKAGKVPVDIRQSPAMLQVLEAGYKKTLGNMKNLTLTTANTSQTAYINACNSAYMKVSSGAFSYQEAIKQAIQETAQHGTTVLYPSGHTDRIDVAVRRSVMTGLGQTCRQISLTNAEEMDCDLLEISAHSGARPSHAVWQGQIVSRSGRQGYLSLSDIGFGTGEGFGGWNCQHDWYPYFEGISTRNYTQAELDALNEKSIEYNGKMYTEYEISQIQRRYEREIRAAKREQAAYKTAVEESNGELQEVMQTALTHSNSVVKDKQAKMREFIRQTGQQRDYFREQNYGNISLSQSMSYMSRFNPKLGERKNLYFNTTAGLKKVSLTKITNSNFEIYSDITSRKDKAVRLTEKNLRYISKLLPPDFQMPTIAIVNFENYNINPLAIGGYDKVTNVVWINRKYDTPEKILGFVNQTEGNFANKTQYAPCLHELGHKYYEDCIKALASSENMSYNEAKISIDRNLYTYIEHNGGSMFVSTISTYAKNGYNKGLFTEVVAECFSIQGEDKIANEIISLLH